jgi:putative transposase
MGLRNKRLFHQHNIFFITTSCYKKLNLLSIGNSKDFVSESLKFCCEKYKASIIGFVLMPNHIHMILHFVKGIDRIHLMRDFKKYTSFLIRKEVETHNNDMLEQLRFMNRKQRFKVWQDRFDEVFLITKKVLEIKLRYIHNNPLQKHWQLVDKPEDYKYSSALFYEKEIQHKLGLRHYLDFM